jgi:hypothetical protein
MTHLTEEDLVLHHFGEPGPASTSSHLALCAGCRERLELLRADLRELAPLDHEPGPDYPDRLWRRLEPRLLRRPGRPGSRNLGYLALAASLLLAFVLGRNTAAPLPITEQARERILLVAVGRHLERSRLVLAELTHAEPGRPLELGRARSSAGALVEEGRLYTAAAERAGEPGLVALLEELQRTLVDVANAPDVLDARETAEMQRRIEARGLVFKVRVIERDLAERTGSPRRPDGVS